MLIHRNLYWEKIKNFIDKPVVKVITGMRRVGKSYFIKQIIEELQSNEVSLEQIIYIDKENIEFDFIKTYRDLYDYVKNKLIINQKKKYLFIDKIQEIEKRKDSLIDLVEEKLKQTVEEREIFKINWEII